MRGSALLSVEGPVPVPTANIENGFTHKVYAIELGANEIPVLAMILGIWRFSCSNQAVAEVELVIPIYGVDTALNVRTHISPHADSAALKRLRSVQFVGEELDAENEK